MKISKRLKILKIKKGFITNSSGSYEWLPVSNNAPLTNTPLSLPTTTPIANNVINNSVNNTPKQGLDPNVITLTAILGLIVVVLGAVNVTKAMYKKHKGSKRSER